MLGGDFSLIQKSAPVLVRFSFLIKKEIAMKTKEIKNLLQTEEYDFLRTDPNLGKNICLLTLGGSHAYGTNQEGSDVDIRGIAMNSPRNILLGQDFDTICDKHTDTTIYSFQKIFSLLINCNPNTIELLGNKPEHYFFLSEPGILLLQNKQLFLSQKAIHSFGGYANQQLRRLENYTNKLQSQEKQEQHIFNTIKNMDIYLQDKYHFPEHSIELFIDQSKRPDFDTEIFCDINLKHYALRDYNNIMQEMNAIIAAYNKVGKRNQNALSHAKISKHIMHLVRLYYMCFDILEKGEINTYREKEHEELMAIRNGKYLDKEYKPTPELYELINELEKRLQYDASNTCLPVEPDYDKLNDLQYAIMESYLKTSFKEQEEQQRTEMELDESIL